MFTQISERRHQRGEEGFTLIELLIVIVVLGILAAVVVFTVGSVTSRSAQTACAADAKSIESAVASYNAQHGTAIGLETFASGTAGTTQQALLISSYLNAWPSNGTHYKLALAYTGNSATPVAATAGQVMVYAPSSATTPVTYDAQTSTTGCNTPGI